MFTKNNVSWEAESPFCPLLSAALQAAGYRWLKVMAALLHAPEVAKLLGQITSCLWSPSTRSHSTQHSKGTCSMLNQGKTQCQKQGGGCWGGGGTLTAGKCLLMYTAGKGHNSKVGKGVKVLGIFTLLATWCVSRIPASPDPCILWHRPFYESLDIMFTTGFPFQLRTPPERQAGILLHNSCRSWRSHTPLLGNNNNKGQKCLYTEESTQFVAGFSWLRSRSPLLSLKKFFALEHSSLSSLCCNSWQSVSTLKFIFLSIHSQKPLVNDDLMGTWSYCVRL